MTKFVLLSGSVHEDGMKLLEEADGVAYEVVEDKAEILAKRLPEADALVIRLAKVDDQMLDASPNLKVISRYGVGCDNLPIPSLTERGIPVMITGLANSESVAEHALYFMLSLARKGLHMDKVVRECRWADRLVQTNDLAGRRLLVMGLGRIGRFMVAKAAALGLKVTVFDPFVDSSDCEKLGAAHAADLHAALPEADIVSLHLPDGGTPVIGARELELMPAHSLLINVSRGGLIDEQALAASLKSGGIAGAGLDVYSQEPAPAGHPLIGLDNVVLTPHTAALTDESARRMAIACVQNAIDVLAGKIDEKMVFNQGWDKS